MLQGIRWDQALIEKYNYSGPRYTSYPTALEFSEGLDPVALLEASQRDDSSKQLSLYVHIPFCHTLCYYCGCNKVITRHQEKADTYLDFLAREIQTQAPRFRDYTVTQMHWGGGSPSFLTREQMLRLATLLRQHFAFAADAELSIELDPRDISPDSMLTLREAGFNRLSMGVQDFNPQVQQAVNRVHDEAHIRGLFTAARANGINSVNIDLIYGLPHQTVETFAETLDKAIALSPDRLSVFNYAHLPARFAAQRKIKDETLPSAETKLEILQLTIDKLCGAGYQYIGMDHFAKPEDELARAQRSGELHRNFQGYTTQGQCDLLGLGVSSISQIGPVYAQNQKDLKSYYASIDASGHALWKGLKMTPDDELRGAVIRRLICDFELDFSTIEQQFGIDFRDYFAADLALLKPMLDDQLVLETGRGLEVTPAGRLLIRNICMCFDVYMRNQVRARQFSRVI